MHSSLRNIVLMGVMLCASILGVGLQPTHKISDDKSYISLEDLIPKTFGSWREVNLQMAQVVNPQQQDTINKIYSQTLSRTYVDNNGYQIMLVVAYGAEQNDNNKLHYPEVCYPSQGFQILLKHNVGLDTNWGVIKAKNLVANNGQRTEPITYWTLIGDSVVRGSSELKLKQLTYGLRGSIPDGMLVRFSSIDNNVNLAFDNQRKFVSELLNALNKESRERLIGKVEKS